MATLVNGLRPIEAGVEFYRVVPGGATEIRIEGDDRIRLIDRHGGQTANLAARGGNGLKALGLSAEPGTVFGPDSRPGSEITLVAEDATTLIVSAPGGRIVDGDVPASELLVEIRRAAPQAREQVELPAPLAEPRLDFRVDKASALSYEVKQGEFIQVIDVQGKQCSDFLAFHAAKLQQGLERGLDATVTRTLMGTAYPTPGLYGKFYDLDMDPLVEVIRDTVGRHDTFALACQAKYYEDLGYPGHINCTDNFNGALKPFTIAPRKGWEALNFFYNTAFDSNNQLVSDEPWSRPGDYVMLRAMTDLVCASSACPDDVDPSNAWEVTDVHVRVYSPQNRFSVAIAHRVTADAPPVLTQETAFHTRTEKLTKSFLEYRGYWLPHCFNNEGGIAEYWACREKVAVMDLSPLRKWEVLGPDAETLIQKVITRDARKLAVGQVVYTPICNETGGMIDDATVFRLGRTTSASSAATSTTASGCARSPIATASRPGSSRPPISCTTSPSRDRTAARPLSRSSGPRPPSRASPSSSGSASWSAGSGPTTASRSSSRGPATPASLATRSSAIRQTPERCGTPSSRRAPPTASSPSASRRSTCSGSSPA
jgi:aminomethyltransferase